jgi:hypothetical protein
MQHIKDKYIRLVYGDECMDAAKFLRALADLINAAQDDTEDNVSAGTEIQSDETDVMVPPLQQEIELMKRATKVDSVFDKTEEVEVEVEEPDVNEIGASNDDNELSILKKNAGLGLGLVDASAKGYAHVQL